MKKRSFLFFILMFVSLVSLVQFASAAYGYFDLKSSVENLINIVVEFSSPFLQAILGGDYWDGQMLFEKFLLFAVLVSIVYVAMSKAPFFKREGGEPIKGVVWTISLIVPILSIRYIDMGWLNTILMTYQVFGIAMTTLLPLIIYFFFLQGVTDSSGTVSKIGWILFICVYLGLYTTTDRTNYSQWYLVTAFLALIFLLLDGTIRRYYLMQKMKQAGATSVWDQINKLEEQKHRFYGTYSSTPVAQREAAVREIDKKIAELRKYFT